MKTKQFLSLLLMALLLPCTQIAAHTTVTVADGITNSQYIPIEGYNADYSNGQQNQMLYPATMLTELQGLTIGSMKFYIDPSANNGTYTNADGEITDYKPYGIVDARLSWNADSYTMYVEANNLLNKTYVDFGHIPQPGSWWMAGLRFAW